MHAGVMNLHTTDPGVCPSLKSLHYIGSLDKKVVLGKCWDVFSFSGAFNEVCSCTCRCI